MAPLNIGGKPPAPLVIDVMSLRLIQVGKTAKPGTMSQRRLKLAAPGLVPSFLVADGATKLVMSVSVSLSVLFGVPPETKSAGHSILGFGSEPTPQRPSGSVPMWISASLL